MPVVEDNVDGLPKNTDVVDCNDDDQSNLDQYRKESYRLQTFQSWPKHSHVTKEDLARNGFYYLGLSDRVKCTFCNLILKDWEANDIVENEHRRHSPRCPLLLQKAVGNVPASIPVASRIAHVIVDPAYPNFRDEHERLKSFEDLHWPPSLKQKPDALAKAGFFYTGNGDAVKCFQCAGLIRNWDEDDQPAVEHMKWFPECPFIQEYIAPIEEEWAKRYPEELVKKFNDYRRSHNLPKFESERDFHYQIEQFSFQPVNEHAPVQESVGASALYSLPSGSNSTYNPIDIPDGKEPCKGCDKTNPPSWIIQPCRCPCCDDCYHVSWDISHCPACTNKIKAVQSSVKKKHNHAVSKNNESSTSKKHLSFE